MGIFNGYDIGGCPCDHMAGFDLDELLRISPAFHELIQQFGCFVSAFFGGDRHAGKMNTGESADHFIVINPDDGHLVRHGQGRSLAGLGDLLAAFIDTGHEPDRLGQREQPIHHELLFLFPQHPADSSGGPVKINVEAGLQDSLLKSVAAPPGPEEISITAKCKMTETSFNQMTGRHPANGLVVAHDVREPWNGFCSIVGYNGGDAEPQNPGHV